MIENTNNRMIDRRCMTIRRCTSKCRGQCAFKGETVCTNREIRRDNNGSRSEKST